LNKKLNFYTITLILNIHERITTMIYNIFFKETLYFYQTLMISLVLAVVAIPFLWSLSLGNMEWIFLASILWGIGVFTFFFPFIKFIFPQMLTSIGVFLLGLILSLVTIWFNIHVIIFLMGEKDIYDSMILGVSFNALTIFGWFYVIVTGVIVHGILYHETRTAHSSLYDLIINHKNFYKNILNGSLMVLFLFLIPLAVLFIEEISYDFRVLIALVSLGIGFWFIYKKTTLLVSEKSLFYTTTLVLLMMLSIIIIHATIIMAVGYEKIPAKYMEARVSKENIKMQKSAINFSSPSYQIDRDENSLLKQSQNKFYIYKSIFFLPIIELNLGYKIDDINGTKIEVKENKNGAYIIKTEMETLNVEP